MSLIKIVVVVSCCSYTCIDVHISLKAKKYGVDNSVTFKYPEHWSFHASFVCARLFFCVTCYCGVPNQLFLILCVTCFLDVLAFNPILI